MNPEYYDEVHRTIANNPALLAQQRKRLGHVAEYCYANVLDVGCGLGTLANLLKGSDTFTWYTGIDFSLIALQLAKKKCNHKNFDFYLTDIFEWEFTDDFQSIKREYGFTTIVFSEILEHVENPKDILEIYSELSVMQKSKLIITLPVNMPTSQEPSHVKGVWSEDEVRDLVDGIGDITELHTFGGDNNNTWWLCVVDVK